MVFSHEGGSACYCDCCIMGLIYAVIVSWEHGNGNNVLVSICSPGKLCMYPLLSPMVFTCSPSTESSVHVYIASPC